MFQIDLKSRKAVYDQIVDNFKRLIEKGALNPGEDLPAPRAMAKTLIVNPHTIQKAYLELENQGYFYTEDGQDWAIATDESNKEKMERKDDVSALYGRLHADIQELIARGELREDIGKLIGMGEQAYITLEDVNKNFNGVQALNALKMNVKKGSIYGLVGTNGSGKTTTLKHLAGIYYPDAGTIRVDGLAAYDNAHGKTVGYMQEDLYFLPDYTMKMFHGFFKDKHKKTWNEDRYQEMMALFGLSDTQTVCTFSRGMQKQAGFIFAISAMPDVLLLDETIDGLDPIVRKQALKYIIEDVAEREMTVVLTSHNMRELDGICDTIGIIKAGRMVIERDLGDLRTNVHKIQVAFPPDFLLNNFPYDSLDVLHMEELGSTDLLVVRGKEDEIAKHIQQFAPLVYDHLPMTLEEIFIFETEDEIDD
ncbi:MAG: ATP-binding cassette domain-containing protein [Oscillospiraceae bacterium]|nr:ATP-binding cassette domain-containing protein [Oscillospiraceae bacterium]